MSVALALIVLLASSVDIVPNSVLTHIIANS